MKHLLGLGLGLGGVRVFATPYVFDPDADNYINRVQTADGQALEFAVRTSYDRFFVDTKADGSFAQIDRCACILGGARTLAGALTPLKAAMPLPTNNGFVAGDYSRTLGLNSGTSNNSKSINTNASFDSTYQNNHSFGFWSTRDAKSGSIFMGTGSTSGGVFLVAAGGSFLNSRSSTNTLLQTAYSDGISGFGLYAVNRTLQDSYYVANGSVVVDGLATTSSSPLTTSIRIFRRDEDSVYGNHRGLFFWTGRALNLSALNTRIATLESDLIAALS